MFSPQLDKKVYLAPMAGITDLPFRKLCRRFGDVVTTGEMLSSDLSLANSPKSLNRQVHLAEPEPRAVQIVGWDPTMMADAARFNVDQSASVIDINMGCPAKKVCRKLAGSALLADEEQVEKILSAVCQAVTVPVTLKIRTGVSPDRRNGTQIAKIAEQCGISRIAVHGRTRACKFHGVAEYETIKAIKHAVSIPVIVNGDLDSFEKIKTVLNYTQADGVMIGRAANGKPWFPAQVLRFLQTGIIEDNPSLEQQRKTILNHLQSIYDFYGHFMGVRVARKHIKWYLNALSTPFKINKQVVSTDNPEHQLAIVADHYDLLQNQMKAA